MHAVGSAVHPSRTPALGCYRLDPRRTTIRFRARHMFGIGVVTGEFALRHGYIDIADPLTQTTVRAVVSADSIDTGRPTRDRAVRSSTYLDAATHPDLAFVAGAVHSEGDQWVLDGALDAHGVAVPLRINVDAVNVAAAEISVHASAQVDRYAHGITAGRGIAGRRLAIEITAVAVRDWSGGVRDGVEAA